MKISASDAKQKGFISRDNLIEVNEDYYYLWLCELQMWLGKQHRVINWVSPYIQYGDIKFNHQYVDLKRDGFHLWSDENKYETPDEALEAGLIEILKTIPDVI